VPSTTNDSDTNTYDTGILADLKPVSRLGALVLFETIVSRQEALQAISSHGEHYPGWQDMVAGFGVDVVCLGSLMSMIR
jgi:hypothetical protein